MNEMNTQLCVVRHGETNWNIQRRIQGQLDVPLNAHGQEQAQALAQYLRGESFAACYSSDLLRAQQTAQTLIAGTAWPLHFDAALRERHYGELQGLTAEEVAQQAPHASAYYVARDVHYAFATGESLHHFAQRVLQGVSRLARQHVGETLLLVTHGGVLDVLYRHATGRRLESARDFSVPNVGVNWLDLKIDRALPDAPVDWQVRRWAEQHHLQELGREELPA